METNYTIKLLDGLSIPLDKTMAVDIEIIDFVKK